MYICILPNTECTRVHVIQAETFPRTPKLFWRLSSYMALYQRLKQQSKKIQGLCLQMKLNKEI